MKKLNLIFYFLIVFTVLALGCTKDSNEDLNAKVMENQMMRLNVFSASDNAIIATEENGNKYKISNSQLNITDDKGNILSWNDLKDAKAIEVNYSGRIKEISPAIFEKITNIVIIS